MAVGTRHHRLVAAALIAMLTVALLPTGFRVPHPAVAAPGGAAPLAVDRLLSGLNHPTFVARAGDGSRRLFVLERAGRVIVSHGDQLQAEPFLDITALVGTDDMGASEQGLLG